MMVQGNSLVKTLGKKRTYHPWNLWNVHPWRPSAVSNIKGGIDSWHQNCQVRSTSPHAVNLPIWTEEPKAMTSQCYDMKASDFSFPPLSIIKEGWAFPFLWISFRVLMSPSHAYLCVISSPQTGPTTARFWLWPTVNTLHHSPEAQSYTELRWLRRLGLY